MRKIAISNSLYLDSLILEEKFIRKNKFQDYNEPWVYSNQGDIYRIQYPSSVGAFKLELPTIQNIVEDYFGNSVYLFQDKINYHGGYKPHYDLQDGWDQYADNFFTMVIPLVETNRFSFAVNHNFSTKTKYDYDFSNVQWHTQHLMPGDAVLFDGRELHKTAPETDCAVWIVSFVSTEFPDAAENYKMNKWKNYPPGDVKEKQQNMY